MSDGAQTQPFSLLSASPGARGHRSGQDPLTTQQVGGHHLAVPVCPELRLGGLRSLVPAKSAHARKLAELGCASMGPAHVHSGLGQCRVFQRVCVCVCTGSGLGTQGQSSSNAVLKNALVYYLRKLVA